ncbi:MAG: HPP family protein [Pseudomonadales bacterium]
MRSWIWRLRHVMGVPQHVPSWREQVVGSVTALAGIALVAVLGWTESLGASPWLLTSMGATAVLVFTVPHGMLSQPWAVLGGHTFSALSGLLVLHVLGQGVLACAVAVSLSIGVMHVTRCIHPPGGATTLFVVQSASTAAAGLDLLLSPVLLNVASILLAAVALNHHVRMASLSLLLAFFSSHDSPAPQQLQQLLHEAPFTEKELALALDGMDETFDISDEQIQLLYGYVYQSACRS